MSVTISAPQYDLKKTLTCGQVFRYNELPGGLWEVISTNKVCKVWTAGQALCIDCEDENNDYWVRYFNPMEEPEVLRELMSQNVVMQAAYDFSKGTQLLRQDPFECLISFIISQQKRIPQIQTGINRLCELCGEYLSGGVYSFPEPSKITREAVAELRMGYRAPYIYNAAQEVASGNLALAEYTADKVTYQEAMQRLQRLSGVGVKIADCVALFSLGFTNAFPVDTHIQQLLNLPEMKTFREEECGSYAGLVQQYLYNYALYNGY